MTNAWSIASVVLLSVASASASPFAATRAYVVHETQLNGNPPINPETTLDSASPGNIFTTFDSYRGIEANFDAEPATLKTHAYTEVSNVPGGAGGRIYLEPRGYIEFTTAAPFSAQYIDGSGEHVQSTYKITQLASGAFAHIDGSAGQSLQFPAPAGAYRIDFFGNALSGTGAGHGFDTLALTVVPEPAVAACTVFAGPLLRRRRRN